jgi:hypothetical protein
MIDQNQEERLTSWKQIAYHLGVTVRTAQNWERNRGLPVCRDGQGPKARVFTSKDELDRWRRRQTESTDLHPTRPSWGARSLVVGLLLVALVTGSYYFASDDSSRGPAAARYLGHTLEVWDKQGRTLWVREFPDCRPGVSDHPWPWARLHDVDGDNVQEVLLALDVERNAETYGRFLCFESDGSLLWEKEVHDELHFGDRTFNRYYINQYGVLQLPGHSYLLVCFGNDFFPSINLLLDPTTGAEVSRYVHPGHLESFALCDVNDDGKQELLLGGVNNPGPGLGYPSLVALDIPFPKPKRSAQDLFGLPGGQEETYLLLPRQDIDVDQPYLQRVTRIDTNRAGEITVTPSSPYSCRFVFSRSLEPITVRAVDAFVRIHRKLRLQGLLDHDFSPAELEAYRRAVHRFPTAPNGNSEAVRKLMAVDIARQESGAD